MSDFTPLWSAAVPTQQALTGDINGDGKLEVIPWGRPNLRVYDSEGHDLWNVSISGSPTGATAPVLLDVTGDIIPEIAIGRLTSPGDLLQILVYDGSGSLLKRISRSGCPHGGIYPWLAGDLNNDGEIEILAALDAGYCRYTQVSWGLKAGRHWKEFTDNVIRIQLRNIGRTILEWRK